MANSWLAKDLSEAEKVILLPVTHHDGIELRQYVGKDNLKAGHYGIPTPQTSTYRGTPELVIVPGASHVDLYDNKAKIPFARIEAFFQQNLK